MISTTVQGAPVSYSSIQEINTVLNTLLQYKYLQPVNQLSSKIKLHYSIKLLQVIVFHWNSSIYFLIISS